MYILDILKSMIGFPPNNTDVRIYSFDNPQKESSNLPQNENFFKNNQDDMFREIEQMFTEMNDIGKIFTEMNDMDKIFGSFQEMPKFQKDQTLDKPLHERMLKPPGGQGQEIDIFAPKRQTPFSFGSSDSIEDIFAFPELPSRGQQNKRDTDLDTLVKNKSDFVEMYKNDEPSKNTISRVRVWSRISADGKVEERRTVDDGQGNRCETVTKKIGDQGYEVETKTTSVQETIEINVNYKNMSKEDKQSFEHHWKQPSVDHKGRQFPEQLDPQTRTIFRNLFGDGFPGFGRD